jgi:hypothetical protein
MPASEQAGTVPGGGGSGKGAVGRIGLAVGPRSCARIVVSVPSKVPTAALTNGFFTR